MKDIKQKKDTEKEIKEYFQSLNLDGWTVLGNVASGGQADIIEVKNNETGELGVFRTLSRKKESDISRFHRELEILSEIDHPNIVKILDFTKDKEQQWYISKKGNRFEGYWKTYFEKNIDSPDLVLEEAIRIVNALTDGLIDLHKKGIIHRDIKAKNIVLNRNVPVLIDFGIAFITGEERLTPIDEAVSNHYSPDPSLNFMDNVPPWLDVFLLSQLLIWMVSEGTNKPHIQRPLDWRWVVYPKFTTVNILKIKAVTGLCSNYLTSPKDASEFKILLNKLFLESKPRQDSFDFNRIAEAKKAIQNGISLQLAGYAEVYSLIESRLPLFTSICYSLENGIKKIIDELSSEFNFNLLESEFIDNFMTRFNSNKTNELLQTYQTTFNYSVGEGKHGFGFSFSYVLFTKKGIENSPNFKDLENKPFIVFHLNDSRELSQKGKTQNYYLVPNDNGVLILQDGNMENIKEVTILEIIEMVKNSITDPEVWKTVYSQ